MANSLELLEARFRQVEEASERKILDERELAQQELVDSSTQSRRCRKKPAVSTSQFGKQDEPRGHSPHSLASSPRSSAAPAPKSTFYHTLGNPRSFDSFVSEISEQARQGEEQHELQVERIAGRQTLPKTVGAFLPRRLARAQSHLDYVPLDRNMVIDVSVETTTESSCLSPNSQASTIYAGQTSRPRAATVGVSHPHGSLVERARDFARKLRHKSKAEPP